MPRRSLLPSLGHLVLAAVALQLTATTALAGAVTTPLAQRPGPAPAGFVDMPAWSFESDVANRQLGTIATTAGDVNGDGYSDVVTIGRINASTAALYLFFGGPSGPTLAPGYPVTNVPTGTSGPLLNPAGDVNGDGFADIILGFPNGAGGSIRIYYGGSAGFDLAHPFEYTVTFPPSFGQVVGPAGDVNGDGYDDVIVGAPQAGPALQICGGGSNQGRVDVYYGSAAGLRTDNPWVLWGCEWFASGMAIGTAAGTAGDVNADGYDDIVIGGNAIAYVVYGSSIGLPIRPNSFGEGWLSGATQVNPFNTGDGTGQAVCGAGDLNGDGYADVLIGSPSDDTYATDCGFARALLGGPSGLTSTIFWSESSVTAFAHFGGTMSTAGDLNGDGLADVLVGESTRIGVFQSQGTTLFSTLNPINIGGGGFTRGFCTAGDVNGDGLSDIVVGDGAYTNGQSLEGHLLYFAGRGEGPTTTSSWSTKTMLTNPNFGWSVSSAGDVNGDGLDDYVMGAPTLPNIAGGENNNGGVFMNFGKVGGPTPNFSDWSSLGSPEDQLGIAVASAYDINGDGFADFVAGAHAGGVGKGKAYVYYGHANPWSSSSAANLILQDNTTGGQFGAAVAGGDFNGDGYGDVAVGAPMNDGPKGVPSHAGQVFVYLGGPAGLNPTPAWTGSGTQADEHYGASVCADADVNGDGYMDLVVGAPQHDSPGNVDAGALFEYHGTSGGSPLLFFQMIEGDKTGYGMGQALAHAGDVNGDGYGDVITGEPNANGGIAQAFAGTSSGLNPSPLWEQSKFEVGSGFGSSVSCAGDVDGDGLSDVLVGAVFEDAGGAQDRGSVRVFPGPLTNGVAPLWTAFGTTAFQNLGHASANAGDVNGDGWSDLLFGEPGYSVDLFRQGICELFPGAQGRGRVHLMGATAGGHRVQPLGFTDPTGFNLVAITRSAAGRSRIKMQWKVEGVPRLTTPSLSGVQSGFTLTNPPGALGSYAILQQPITGVLTGLPYSWRMRSRSRAVYFPTSAWLMPPRSGSREYDLRAPGSWVGIGDEPTASALELAAPRPNPMRARSMIGFTLPSAGQVSLAILDVQGRTLRTLADGVMPAGPHQVAWDGMRDDGGRAPAGVYFYQLVTGGKSLSRKVALLP